MDCFTFKMKDGIAACLATAGYWKGGNFEEVGWERFNTWNLAKTSVMKVLLHFARTENASASKGAF